MQTIVRHKKLTITLDGIACIDDNITDTQKTRNIFRDFLEIAKVYEDTDISEIEINLNNLNITGCYFSKKDMPDLNASELQLDKRVAKELQEYIVSVVSGYFAHARGYLLLPILKEVEKVTINMRKCLIWNHNAEGEEIGLTIAPLIFSSNLKEFRVNIEHCEIQYAKDVGPNERGHYLTIEPRIYNKAKEQKTAPETVIHINNCVFKKARVQIYLCNIAKCDDNPSLNTTNHLVIENSRFIDYTDDPIEVYCACRETNLRMQNITFSNLNSRRSELHTVINLTEFKEATLQDIIFFEPKAIPASVEHYIFISNTGKLLLGPIRFIYKTEETNSSNALIYVSPDVEQVYITGKLIGPYERPVLDAPPDKTIVSPEVSKIYSQRLLFYCEHAN